MPRAALFLDLRCPLAVRLHLCFAPWLPTDIVFNFCLSQKGLLHTRLD